MTKIDIKTEFPLLSAPEFAVQYLKHLSSDSGRKEVYRLIDQNKIDYTVLGKTKFVVMNERTNNWIKSN